MIESQAGLDAADEIAAVDGVDMVLVGRQRPQRRAGRRRDRWTIPQVHEAYLRVIEVCRAHGKAVGIGGLGGRPDLIRRYLELGASYVSTGNDISFLSAAASAEAAAVRLMTPDVRREHP